MGYVVKCDELEKAMCYVMKRDEQKKERRLKEKYLRCRRLLAHRTKIAKKGRNVKKRSGRKSTKKCLAKFEGKTSSPSIVSRKCSWCRPRAAHGARSPKKAKLRRKGFEGRPHKKGRSRTKRMGLWTFEILMYRISSTGAAATAAAGGGFGPPPRWGEKKKRENRQKS